MARLREVPRTAAFAWSPGAGTPLLATGTKAGAVDASFSSETQLELWDLHLGGSTGQEPQSVARIETDSRFHDIAWVESPNSGGSGVIAGALESGSLDIWDAQKLLDGQSPFISRTTNHSGAIKALQFNPAKRELLATAGAKGELFVSDLDHVESPYRLGSTAARADDFECVDWNKKVSHIMVTGSNGGFVTVWDVKMKKESLTLNNYGRKPVGAVAWDPEKSTRLATAVPLDQDPLILVWDLRNSNAPEKILRGHDGGVLSLSWCSQDNDLLLSCGKDNKTICWNAQSGEPFGEFPVVTNWTFQTSWNPRNPNILATASFNGKIAVHSLQSIGRDKSSSSQAPLLDGEDFFNRAQSQPQVASFSLPKAPKWLKRPVGASFGFGGKLVTIGVKAVPDASEVKITDFEIDPEISAMTTSFTEAIRQNDLAAICRSRINESKADNERGDWRVLETLIAKNPRKELLSYLGFKDTTTGNTTEKTDGHEDPNTLKASPQRSQQNGELSMKTNRLSAFFEGSGEGDNFLADLASTKGAKTNNPFQIYADDEPETDKKITQALMLGHFDQALELSLGEGRLSDAFMIAICGGQNSIGKVQKAYFQKKASGPRYLRLLASIVGKNLWDVVHNADLQNWKEVMATLCTYASAEDFSELCEALGDRLEEHSAESASRTGLSRNTSFCYLAGSRLEKVVNVWIDDLRLLERQQAGNNKDASNFTVHARALQSFIEKVTVFREATQYQDKELREDASWKLEPLYQKYVEYADIVAAHGNLELAEAYLKLLPELYIAGSIARTRIKEATRKPPTHERNIQARATGQATNRPSSSVTESRVPFYSHPQQTFAHQQPPQMANTANAFSAPGVPGIPTTSQPPGSRPLVPPPPSFGAPSQGPPIVSNTPPSVAPSRLPSTTNWNDTPADFFKPPTSRRGTPAAQPVPGASVVQAPSMAPTGPNAGAYPSGSFSRGPPPVAPPPKGPPPPARSMTPQGPQAIPQPDRPASAASSAYAPTQIPGEAMPQPQISRGRSPYNAPPTNVPHNVTNRYAPTLQAQQLAAPAQNQRPPPPPSNSFAPRPPLGPSATGSQADGSYGGSARPPPGASVPQRTGPPPRQQEPTPPPPKTTTPKYPPGDRTHIPEPARPIYDILSSEMQRVKPLAPTTYKTHVNDAEKRLNILFDHLNNESLLKPNTVGDMVELAKALHARDYDKAMNIHLDLFTNRTDECANWMPGVKRLIGMSKATP